MYEAFADNEIVRHLICTIIDHTYQPVCLTTARYECKALISTKKNFWLKDQSLSIKKHERGQTKTIIGKRIVDCH